GRSAGDPVRRLAPVLVTVAALWIASSWYYYALVDALALENGYDEAPILFAGFYLIWSGIALVLLRSVLSAHATPRRITGHLIALLPILLAYAAYVTL
ncbi:unnamed protein product, partial [Ectocarpus sp. 12 AP-2014]